MPVHLRDLLTAPNGTREENRQKLLRAVMVKPDNQLILSKRAGMSTGTVSEAVREPETQKYLRSERIGRETFVRMAETTGAIVGIEVGRHAAAIVGRRADQDYSDAAFRTVQVGIAAGASTWIRAAVQAVRDVVDELEQEDVVAVGLGVPWMVNPRQNMLVPPVLPPWREGDDPGQLLMNGLREELGGGLLTEKVVLDNDANLTAYAESIYASPRAETLIGVKASTGIGAGIIIGGNIFRGMRGVAGELGHTSVRSDGRFCSCGGRGCLETLISTDVIVEQARQALRNDRPPNFDAVVSEAIKGNQACQRVLREAARTLGLALGNLCNVLNPDVVVLGGAFGRDAAPITLGAFEEGIARTAMRAAVSKDAGFQVRTSEIRFAAAHGALVMALLGTVYEST